MGLISGIGLATGAGKVRPPNISNVAGDYSGLLQAYEQNVPGLYDSAATFLPKYSQLYADTAATSLPAATNAVRSASPGLTALLDKILASASGEGASLDYGSPLPPKVQALQAQMSRAGQAARGLGFGPSDVLGETRDATKLALDLTDRNRAFADTAAKTAYATQADPIMRFLAAITGAGNDQLLSPANTLSLMLAPYQGRLSANTSTAANRTGLVETASKGFDQFASSGGLGSMFCWAAREIFGERNPRWRMFRDWLLYRAPESLRDWYCGTDTHAAGGPQWAQRLKRARPEVRAAVRRWMEARIARLPDWFIHQYRH